MVLIITSVLLQIFVYSETSYKMLRAEKVSDLFIFSVIIAIAVVSSCWIISQAQ